MGSERSMKQEATGTGVMRHLSMCCRTVINLYNPSTCVSWFYERVN